MKITNLTPHSIRIFAADGTTEIATIPPSGSVARVAMTRKFAGNLATEGGIPLYQSKAGAVTGLPDAAPGVCYVVSTLVRLAVPNREDVFSPGDLVRDGNGQPVGCKGLEAS